MIVEGAVAQLKAFRKAGNIVTAGITKAVVLAHVRSHAPELLGHMKFSGKWVCSFMQHILGWSFRCGTHPAWKLPADWENQCTKMHARLVYVIKMESIPHPDLVMNADHAGISLMPIGSQTWTERGAQQVDTINHDEK